MGIWDGLKWAYKRFNSTVINDLWFVFLAIENLIGR